MTKYQNRPNKESKWLEQYLATGSSSKLEHPMQKCPMLNEGRISKKKNWTVTMRDDGTLGRVWLNQ